MSVNCSGYWYCSGRLPEPLREDCEGEEGYENCDRGLYKSQEKA